MMMSSLWLLLATLLCCTYYKYVHTLNIHNTTQANLSLISFMNNTHTHTHTHSHSKVLPIDSPVYRYTCPKVNCQLGVVGVLPLEIVADLTWTVAIPQDPFPMVTFTWNETGYLREVEEVVGGAAEGTIIPEVEEEGEGEVTGTVATGGMRIRVRRSLGWQRVAG